MAALRAGAEHLRVPIVPESKDRLVLVAPIVVALGHEVIAREIEVGGRESCTARASKRLMGGVFAFLGSCATVGIGLGGFR